VSIKEECNAQGWQGELQATTDGMPILPTLKIDTIQMSLLRTSQVSVYGTAGGFGQGCCQQYYSK